MPVCTIQLLCLGTDIALFWTALRTSSLRPLTVARVVRWIITPTRLSKDPLLSQPPQWEFLLIFSGAVSPLPVDLERMIKAAWSIQAGVPSKLISSFDYTNFRLLYPSPSSLLPLTGSLNDLRKSDSTQSLELTDELQSWIQGDESPKGAISMLNLLTFIPGEKEQYLEYGKAFSESVGSRRGGMANLVGKLVPGTWSDDCDEWEEVPGSF